MTQINPLNVDKNSVLTPEILKTPRDGTQRYLSMKIDENSEQGRNFNESDYGGSLDDSIERGKNEVKVDKRTA